MILRADPAGACWLLAGTLQNGDSDKLMRFHELHPSLPAWISALEDGLSSLFDGEFALLREAGLAVVGSRGKRLRPVLLLLSCACFGEVDARAIENGCLVELVHTASLVHDDVIDEADLRRDEPSARARWGNKFSILLGDFILARVFELAVKGDDLALLGMLAPAATEMGRGVITELSRLRLDADEEIYWQVVRGKTAALFAAATTMGAYIGGASAEQQQRMSRLGNAFGHAFQLSDDLMDLQGSEDVTGKPLQVDWRQRRATLPLIYAMQHAVPARAAQLRELWEQDPLTDEHFSALRYLVESSGGFDYGWEKVKEYLTDASHCLQDIPAGPARAALLRLCTERFPQPILPQHSDRG